MQIALQKDVSDRPEKTESKRRVILGLAAAALAGPRLHAAEPTQITSQILRPEKTRTVVTSSLSKMTNLRHFLNRGTPFHTPDMEHFFETVEDKDVSPNGMAAHTKLYDQRESQFYQYLKWIGATYISYLRDFDQTLKQIEIGLLSREKSLIVAQQEFLEVQVLFHQVSKYFHDEIELFGTKFPRTDCERKDRMIKMLEDYRFKNCCRHISVASDSIYIKFQSIEKTIAQRRESQSQQS